MTFLWLLLGGLAGGFISGLCGFGAGLVGLPFWLFAVPPVVAAQLAALSGAMGQLQTLPALRRSLSWSHVGPMTLAGLAGVPLRLWCLPMIPVALFKTGVGVLLILYCLFMLLAPARWRLRKRHRLGEILAGIAGGFTGGIAGVPGPPAVMWGALQNWSRHEKRAVFQTFNSATLTLMLVASAVSGLMTSAFLEAAFIVLPATVAGALVGFWLYRRLDEGRFDRIVMSLLLLSGIALVATR